eukprot:CAMPEP_0202483310 /NCGR_PEP_ID=MMETSP1361-20130828/2575_1 /ASSEMBLY_ACC=CAM_ASM_000849 /TAXON_ID=210615 /ORGANISM="Staurosira complex sp., Strain CCMP2646" /LENGTH=109 /DNA_ID=CAMNT_0049111507 /DNA_START=407 /DNA_END=733 /DNA_ORIENTATION=+
MTASINKDDDDQFKYLNTNGSAPSTSNEKSVTCPCNNSDNTGVNPPHGTLCVCGTFPEAGRWSIQTLRSGRNKMTRTWGTRARWDKKEQSGVGGRVVAFSLETGTFHVW